MGLDPYRFASRSLPVFGSLLNWRDCSINLRINYTKTNQEANYLPPFLSAQLSALR